MLIKKSEEGWLIKKLRKHTRTRLGIATLQKMEGPELSRYLGFWRVTRLRRQAVPQIRDTGRQTFSLVRDRRFSSCHRKSGRINGHNVPNSHEYFISHRSNGDTRSDNQYDNGPSTRITRRSDPIGMKGRRMSLPRVEFESEMLDWTSRALPAL